MSIWEGLVKRFRAPPLPKPGTEYTQSYMDNTVNVLRLYFNQLDEYVNNLGRAIEATSNDALSTAAVAEARASMALQTANDARSMAEIASTAPMFVMPPGSLGRYAQFLDTTTQTAAATNTAYPITYDTISQSCGTRLQAASRIQVNEAGIYNFQFSIQLDKTSGGTARFWIWFRVNGADVPNSASEVHIQGNNHEIFTAANLLLPLWANDYVELMWSTSDTSVQLTSRAAAAPVPAVPCVIVTVTNVVSPACGVAQPTPVDPSFANVSLLLHFDQGPVSTVFVDNSATPKTVTRIGSVLASTEQIRFGPSAYKGGSGLGLSVPYSADLDLISSTWCVEGWSYNTTTSGFGTLVDFRGTGAFSVSWGLFFNYADRNLNLYNGPTASTPLFTGLNSTPLNQWFHWAVVRSGSTVTMYINGVSLVSLVYNPPATHSSGIRVGINQAGSDSIVGYLDDLRITKGVARYTASFTPPTAPFPDVGP